MLLYRRTDVNKYKTVHLMDHYSTYYSTPSSSRKSNIFRISRPGGVICQSLVSSKLNLIFPWPVIWTILICLQAFSFHFQLQLGHAGVGRLDPTNERNKDNYFKIFILFCLVHCYRMILMAHLSHTSIFFIIIFSFRFNV